MLANIRIIYRHMLSSERTNHVGIFPHFRLYYNKAAFSTEMAPGWDERLQNMSGGRKKLRKAGGGRVKRSTACKRTNTGGVVFYSLQQIAAAEWDGATIWPQLRAMHCKSTKINGNNSTLDAHHYPDGVLGELHRPPNQEQTQQRQRAPCSNTTAHPDDFHWSVCVGNRCWGATLATVRPLWESPLLVLAGRLGHRAHTLAHQIPNYKKSSTTHPLKRALIP